MAGSDNFRSSETVLCLQEIGDTKVRLTKLEIQVRDIQDQLATLTEYLKVTLTPVKYVVKENK